MKKPNSIKRLASLRGRPRNPAKLRPDSVDLGTPELILKRSLNLTSEPIDLCLERQIINAEEHRAGLHFRWLYTLRYGANSVSASCWLHPHDRVHGSAQGHDPIWRAQREQDYQQAANLLAAHRHDAVLIACLLHNEWPRFLHQATHERSFNNPQHQTVIDKEIQLFQEGLNRLAKHFAFIR